MNRDLSTALAAALLATAPTAFGAGDAVRGQQLYESRCIACHSVEQSRVGPSHQGVLGRRAGSVPGYDYSPALKASRLVWSERTLDAWLADPQRLIPGQKMGVQVKDANDRADLIAYLKAVSPP
ncbi:MAG: cytochrome c family protein [Piscinibacter sp.]|uniref:c-type cytochrome n=1 Tax=Piscinibacter sp. TaxID=1903157 RepID=UPI003D150D75